MQQQIQETQKQLQRRREDGHDNVGTNSSHTFTCYHHPNVKTMSTNNSIYFLEGIKRIYDVKKYADILSGSRTTMVRQSNVDNS